MNEMEGRVYLRCTVQEDRRPHDCKVLQEPYTGYGFGEAALKLASRYRFSPGDPRTPPYEVVIPIYFQLSE
jgi:TonB family protein